MFVLQAGYNSFSVITVDFIIRVARNFGVGRGGLMPERPKSKQKADSGDGVLGGAPVLTSYRGSGGAL